MIYGNDEGRPPFNPIWLTHRYEHETNLAGGLIPLPDDHTRATVEWLARTHPNWEPAQIKLEIEQPPPQADYGLPPGINISEVAIAVVVNELRRVY